MKTKIFFFLIYGLFFLNLPGKAQSLQPIQHGEKWGYMDDRYRLKINYLFQGARNCSEGLCAVKMNGKWGFIDLNGVVVIRFQYEDVGAFRHGVAPVKLNGKYGLIDRFGQFVMDPKYDLWDRSVDSKGNQAVLGENGKYWMLDLKTRELEALAYKPTLELAPEALYTFSGLEHYGLMDAQGKEVIPAMYDEIVKCDTGHFRLKKKGKWMVLEKNELDDRYTVVPDTSTDESRDANKKKHTADEEGEGLSRSLSSGEPYRVVEEMPRFPGCEDISSLPDRDSCAIERMLGFIYKHITYPAVAQEKEIQGTVVVQFIVEKNGELSNIRVVREIGGGCGAEVLRVVKLMPAWIPARLDSEPVRTQFNLPVLFRLE